MAPKRVPSKATEITQFYKKLCFRGWRYISSFNIWNQTICVDTDTRKTQLINGLFQINSEEQMFQPANELADFYLKVPLTKWKVHLLTKWKVSLLSKWKVLLSKWKAPLLTKWKVALLTKWKVPLLSKWVEKLLSNTKWFEKSLSLNELSTITTSRNIRRKVIRNVNQTILTPNLWGILGAKSRGNWVGWNSD